MYTGECRYVAQQLSLPLRPKNKNSQQPIAIFCWCSCWTTDIFSLPLSTTMDSTGA